MGLSRHGTGPAAVVRAYASQVHPVFMLPPIAAAAFGAVLAGRVDPLPAGVHVAAIFGAVYTAHLKDGYVDFHVRGEDDDTPLTARGAKLGLVASSGAVAACLAGLYVLVGPVAVALTAPGWLIGYLHAPYLDMRPVTATAGYPAGIALAIVGGAYVQTGSLSAEAVAFGALFLVLLSGVKIVDDLQDLEWDMEFGKRSVGVALGGRRARRLSLGLMGAALLGVALLAAAGVIPLASVLAAVAFAPVLVVAARRGPTVQTMLLIRGSYLFLAALIAAAWWRPLG